MNGGNPRGCGGSRDKGGIYLECGSANGFGLPMFELIKDPIQRIIPEEIGLTPQGVLLYEIEGITHVFDWVGAKHYPNAADFLEEAIRLGLSRRISRAEDFSRLTSRSKLILVHPRAYIEGLPKGLDIPCPTGRHPEELIDRSTIQEVGALWLVGDRKTLEAFPDKEEDTPAWAPYPIASTGLETRSMPAFSYRLGEIPEGVTLSPGIIMVAPIERIVVVDHPEDPDNLAQSVGAALASTIPVNVDPN